MVHYEGYVKEIKRNKFHEMVKREEEKKENSQSLERDEG